MTRFIELTVEIHDRDRLEVPSSPWMATLQNEGEPGAQGWGETPLEALQDLVDSLTDTDVPTPPERERPAVPCPTPRKRTYASMTEATDHIAQDFRHDKDLRPYVCRCGAIHIGHPFPGADS